MYAESYATETTTNKGQTQDKERVVSGFSEFNSGKPVNEFHKDAIVARYGKEAMTYFNGKFNEREIKDEFLRQINSR